MADLLGPDVVEELVGTPVEEDDIEPYPLSFERSILSVGQVSSVLHGLCG